MQDEVHRLRAFEDKWKRSNTKYKRICEQLDASQKESVVFEQMKHRWEEEKIRMEAEKQWVEDEAVRANEEHLAKQMKILEQMNAAQAKQLNAEQEVCNYRYIISTKINTYGHYFLIVYPL